MDGKKRTQKNDLLTLNGINSTRVFNTDQLYSDGLVTRYLQLFSRLSASLVVSTGLIVIVGWIFDLTLLKSILTNFPSMKTNTAIALICSGLSLLFVTAAFDKRQEAFRVFLSTIVFLIGFITLLQYVFGFDAKIDQLLFTEILPSIGTVYPNRMAPNTAFIFMLIGWVLILINTKHYAKWYTQILISLSFLVLLPTLIGYIYGIDFIYGVENQTKMAINTAFSLALLNLGILLSKPNEGMIKDVSKSSAGGYLARRLLFAAFAIPILLGLVILRGQSAGFYDFEFRYLFLIASFIVVQTLLVWQNARAINKIDVLREKSEDNLFFLSEASKVLSSSLDYKTILRSIVALAVPRLADWCSIDMLDEKGKSHLVASAYKDPKKIKWVEKYRKDYPMDMSANMGLPYVYRTGKSEIYSIENYQMLEEMIPDRKQTKLLKSLKLRSRIVTPIKFKGKIIGAIQFISGDSGRYYNQNDLIIAEELANRAALAIENSNLYKKANDAIKLRDEFISIASHELKTPITTLKVYIQILQKQFSKDMGNVPAYLKKMESQLDKLTMLIADLLDLTKLQAGKLVFQMETFDIDELIKEISESIQLTTQHNIKMENLNGKIVWGDRDRISQVITNLLTNAIKYSPDAKKVIIRSELAGSRVLVSLQDFGIGIDKKHQNKIFERFYQIRDKSERTFPGLGMGLYISYEIIKRHRGEMSVKSEIGKGSTFTFSIPISPATTT